MFLFRLIPKQCQSLTRPLKSIVTSHLYLFYLISIKTLSYAYLINLLLSSRNCPKQPTVFIIDDDDAVRESLYWLLNSADLPVKTFFSAEDFLKECDENLCGCLLLDMQMPGMSGTALLQELRARGIHLPIILVSGQGESPYRMELMRENIVDFFRKPANTDHLLKAIELALQRAKQYNHLCFS